MDARVAHAMFAAVEGSPDSVVLMLDRSACVVYANPAARSLLGWPQQGPCEAVDWNVALAPGQHELVAESVSRLLAGEEGLELDLNIRPAGVNAPRRIRVRVRRAQPTPDDEPLWMCWGSVNAFREQLEEQLRLATERLEQTLDSGSILVFGHDRDLRITWVRNPASGRSAQSLLGLTDRDLLDDPKEAERLMANKRQVIESGQPVRFQQTLTFGGMRCHYDYQVFPERDVRGEVCGVLGIAFDITDRHRAEQALVEEQERKDEFIALLAHELRAPLAPARNILALLRNAPQTALEQERLALVDRQLRYMVRLIDDLLDLSRINRDQMTLQRASFDLAQLLRRLAEPARHRESVQPLPRLEVDIPSEPVPCFGDADRIAQIVANLLENARKFTPANGLIRLSLHTTAHEIRVSVRDTGIGLAPADLERIFERFVQVRPATHDANQVAPSEGLGLGLYLSKRLATMHGGELTAHSQGLGQGSLFTLTLPQALLQASAPRELRPAAIAPGHALRILVVDDHQDACDSLVLLLQAWGYTVEAGRDGLEGLSLAQTFRPHVVIMDIAMPRMDGFELARRLRAESFEPAPYLLALTGFSNALYQDRARHAGIDLYLVKPADPRQLQQVLADWSRADQRL
jgi:signal transduction histidine kinase/ActR/RegA family two-component response regulator